MTMPFGKHRGKRLEEIPDDYLVWVLENTDAEARPTLREAIRDRLGLNPPAARPQIGADVDAILKTTYRNLALDFHPDRRGSHEAMTALNSMNDRLCKAFNL